MKHRWRIALIVLIAAAVVVCGYFAVKAITAPPADSTWISKLQYEDDELFDLTFHTSGERSCPQIPISVGRAEYPLMFDTGCGSGIFFTDLMQDKLEFTLIGETEELNRDGSHRGWSKSVVVDEFSVFGEKHENVQTAISDWTLYSSSPFNGALGLKYFESKVVTLDYEGHRIAVSNHPIDYSKLPDEYVVLPLYRSTSTGQESLPFFAAELNGEPIMVYLDTGKNYSYIFDAKSQCSISEKPSEFCDVSLKIDGEDFILYNIAKINDMAQADGLPYPTMIELNSDQIWKNHLLVTFDLISQRIILRKSET